MEVREALKKRRSIRKFTETPVFEKQIEELLHAAMSGPVSYTHLTLPTT